MALTPLIVQTVPDSLAAARSVPALADPASWAVLGTAFWLGVGTTVLHIAVILVAAWLVMRIVGRATGRWASRFEDLPPIHPGRQRAMTVGNLLVSATRYVVWPIALVTVIAEFGVNIGALIATAGVAGLALGFGAQTLVKDVISGVFLLFDDTIHVGDVITFNGQTGTVEDVGVRLIRVRRFDGEVLMIPAGELRVFGNRSIEFARVIVEIGVAYEQDVDQVVRELGRIADEWADETRDIQLDEKPEVQSVLSLGDSSVVVRVVARVVPGEQWQAERLLRHLVKRRFDERGIEIPFPRRTVYVRHETELPARNVSDASE
jgi:small conductance mechanosensitive channel